MTESSSRTLYGDIDILFLYGTRNDAYRDTRGYPVSPLPAGYKVHPAFQGLTQSEKDSGTNPYGKWDNELEGIWVAKYESSMESSSNGTTWSATAVNKNTGNVLTHNAGNSAQVRVVSKPSRSSWKWINNSNAFKNSEMMYPTLNTHEMKNSEWGAVAFLAFSPYGRSGHEVSFNQCSSYYTGGGPGLGANEIFNASYAYSESTFNSTYAWNTTQGKKASTTGNIYGVYDITAGSNEFTASYINNGNGALTGNDNVNMTSTEKVFFRQNYPTGLNQNSTIFGDALAETYSWFSNRRDYPSGGNPIFKRGSAMGDTDQRNYKYAGVFAFNYSTGKADEWTTYRQVICIDSGIRVTFDANGGNMGANPGYEMVNLGRYTIPSFIPTHADANFLGWSWNKDATEAE
jgi:hypothetical protein